MILRRCKKCRHERKLDNLTCSCGSVNDDTFKAVVVIPGSKGRKRTKSAPTIEAARQAEQELQNELKTSEAPPLHPSPTSQPQQQHNCPTLSEIWTSYFSYIELRNRSYKADIQRYRDYLKGPLGSRPADQIRPADIQLIVDGCIRKGKAPSTTLQVFSLLRAMLNYADRMELTNGLQNPCRKVQVPKFDNKVNNPPTAEDLAKLVEACKAWENQHASRVVLFCAYTGRRMGEVLKLEWNDVNLSEAMVCFRAANTKSGKTQTVPVNKKALEVLRVAEEHRVSQWVFPCSTGKYFSGFHRIWQRIRKAAKMSRHYRFHDLRHGFASTLVSNGVSLYMVKELLGHADIKTTERYAHLATGALREAAGVMCHS